MKNKTEKVIGILFEYMIEVAKVLFLKSLCWISFLDSFSKNVWNQIWQEGKFLDQEPDSTFGMEKIHS